MRAQSPVPVVARRSLPSLLVLMLGLVTSVDGFQDDFEDGDRDGWLDHHRCELDGGYSYGVIYSGTDQSYVLRHYGGVPYGAGDAEAYVEPSLSLGDVVVEADFRNVADYHPMEHAAGLAVRVNPSTGQQYAVYWYSSGSIKLMKEAHWESCSLMRAVYAPPLGGRLKVQAIGPHIAVFIDGTLVLSATDYQGALPPGTIGVVARMGETYIDNVRAEVALPPAPRNPGPVTAWGDNGLGQCDVPADSMSFVAIAAGGQHALALAPDSSIVAWGDNSYGQCDVPSTGGDVVAVSAGWNHSLGLRADGSIVSWGSNSHGQCNVPAPNADFVSISAGALHSLGLKADGSIVAWGLILGTVPSTTGFGAVAAGWVHSVALGADGSLVAWGINTAGQCDVSGAPWFDALAVGQENTFALRCDGAIESWGSNDYGQCNVPEPNADFVAIAAGAFHALGLRRTGEVVAWGDNASGQCDVPGTSGGFVAIAGGQHFSVAIEHNAVGTASPVVWQGAGSRPTGHLHVCAPNPFREATTVRYDVPTATWAEVSVYDAAGRLVRALSMEAVSAGTHRVSWDRRDSAGAMVAPGVYFCRLETTAFSESRKMVVTSAR